MVKPDADEMVTEPLADALRREGQKLIQSKYLIQNTPILPLQLHAPDRCVDPVLVPPGSMVAVLSDAHGMTALEMAKIRPHWQVAGWLPDTKSFIQLQHDHPLPNIHFDTQPKKKAAKKTHRPQAILAIGWAHQVLSQNNYQVSALVQEVRRLLELLPEHGQLLIQDFALPDEHDNFVILDLENDEAIEAMIEFSHIARPSAPKALQGFFVETLPSPRKGVERFRLPMKWAVEFYHRWRHAIANEAPFELTTLSLAEWQAVIEQSGARLVYRAPHLLERNESKEISRVLRFMDEQQHPLPLPAATFTLLIEKLPEEASLTLYERRVSGDKAQDIVISGLKNQDTDENLDVVEIRNHEDDLLPWYLDAMGRVHVLIRSNVARPIINSVPRGTPNLDGRHWAGYLVDALTLPHVAGPLRQELIQQYVHNVLPAFETFVGEAVLGVEYYPAPDYLVQRVRGIFLPLQPKDNNKTFATNTIGQELVLDVLADDVLSAIGSGLIPDGKLEILICQLMSDIGIQPRDTGKFLKQPEVKKMLKYNRDRRQAKVPWSVKMGDHLAEYIEDVPTEKLRAVRSVFVEDQLNEFGRHVASTVEQEFIVPNTTLSANTALCIPMMRDPMGKFLISGEPRKLPIPNRMGTEEALMHLPSFTLPGTVKTVDQARFFLAKQMECDPEDIFVLGPSFFAQPQISAERIYPFLLNASPHNGRWMRWFRPRGALNKLVCPQVEKTTAYLEFKAVRDLGEWYVGFTPDIVNAPTHKTPGMAEPAAPFMAHHPLIMPKPN